MYSDLWVTLQKLDVGDNPGNIFHYCMVKSVTPELRDRENLEKI